MDEYVTDLLSHERPVTAKEKFYCTDIKAISCCSTWLTWCLALISSSFMYCLIMSTVNFVNESSSKLKRREETLNAVNKARGILLKLFHIQNDRTDMPHKVIDPSVTVSSGNWPFI